MKSFGYNIDSPFDKNWIMDAATNEMALLCFANSCFYDGINFGI